MWSTCCVVSTRSRKVNSATEIDAGCGKGRMLSLSPQVVKCGNWYVSKHTGHRRGRDQQVCCGSKSFSRRLWNAVNQKLGQFQVPVVHQGRMAGFTLDIACKSGPIDVAVCHKDAGKAHEVTFWSGVDQTRSLFLVRQLSRCEKVVTIPDSTQSKSETVVAKPTNCLAQQCRCQRRGRAAKRFLTVRQISVSEFLT